MDGHVLSEFVDAAGIDPEAVDPAALVEVGLRDASVRGERERSIAFLEDAVETETESEPEAEPESEAREVPESNRARHADASDTRA
ncbi:MULTISPECIES: hypothetical protein [unclassified Haloferax]|uniref:hypothetical protein n=1 Tax=unclassified Haloferax TaxID=2625095 RepID=UPI0002B0F05D|nr:MULTISPECIES: hypothetical protein [unclassified Haloferax]ELZ55764.1 hypothetical protein C460_14870 [Haloferax sp. ATCC BAA-646]ELZ67283.1 hypothetical protein C459_02280 [Haloferax sp. ATCC BAA-645]ELZ68375.1 hypothetical protein C458_10186 [Haloferax sp. ATCC BAA-644]